MLWGSASGHYCGRAAILLVEALDGLDQVVPPRPPNRSVVEFLYVGKTLNQRASQINVWMCAQEPVGGVGGRKGCDLLVVGKVNRCRAGRRDVHGPNAVSGAEDGEKLRGAGVLRRVGGFQHLRIDVFQNGARAASPYHATPRQVVGGQAELPRR